MYKRIHIPIHCRFANDDFVAVRWKEEGSILSQGKKDYIQIKSLYKKYLNLIKL